MSIHIDYTITCDDDGYRVRDWFRGGQATLDAAAEAASPAEADSILRAAYLGPDIDGVEALWRISVTYPA